MGVMLPSVIVKLGAADRTRTFIGSGIDIGPIVQEHLDELVVSGGGGDYQRRPTVVVCCVYRCFADLKRNSYESQSFGEVSMGDEKSQLLYPT